MNNDKTLLISNGCHSDKIIDPNEILLRFLSSSFIKDSLYRVIITNEKLRSKHDTWLGHKCMAIKRIRDTWYSLFKFLSFLPDSFNYIYILIFVIPGQSRQLARLIKKEEIIKIWAVMTSPQVIFLIRKLMEKNKGIKIYSSVWDSPEEFSLMLHMPVLFRQKMLRDFSYVMNNSIKLGVASTNMKKEYELRFNKECFVLQGDIIENIKEETPAQISDNYLIIGFAGWLYTPEVWDALFQSLDLLDWKINGKDVKIRIIGNAISFAPSSHCMIEYFGQQPVNKVRDILSESFINFVPYRFSEITKYGSSVSFPSKINTYLSAKKPIFTIAPSYSTPSQFVNEFEVGISCNSLLPENILSCLNKFNLSESNYQKYVNNCEKVYNGSFHPLVFKKTFCEFIDLF
jgi:hypothetical protein